MNSLLQTRVTTVCSFGDLGEADFPTAGGKGGSLARLYQAGLPVPDGFVLLPSAFAGGSLRPEAWREARLRLQALREEHPGVSFAIRSSAAGEDSATTSFAGEFTTVLGVDAYDEVRAAIDTVYESRLNERASAYGQARGLTGEPEMAVVVQCMVGAECAGILFTADPVTGRRDHAVVNAAWGLGEAIVGGLVTPDTVVFDKVERRVLRSETADKQLMTVRVGAGTEERPVPEELRRKPVLDDNLTAELVQLGMRCEALYGLPVDVEWARQANAFFILQARPITALPEPEPPPPTDWTLPRGVYAVLRNNIVELMAEPLSPLFRTLGLAAVNASLQRLLTSFFGKKGIMPDEVIITVNGYAYYSGSLRFKQILWLLWHGIGVARRMFDNAIGRWLDFGRPAYLETVARWQNACWRDMSGRALLDALRSLTGAAVDAYGALVSGAIPGAWISEGLFTFVYDRLVKGRGDPPASTYLLGYDTAPIRAEKNLYALASWARTREDLAHYLEGTPTPRIVSALQGVQAPVGVPAGDWTEWRSRFLAHLRLHGHTIYNLDFANPVPADEPGPLLDTFRLYLAGGGVDPHARQRTAAERREQATAALAQHRGGRRLRLCRRLLAIAQRYAPLREDGLAEVGLAYPLLREAAREIGRRCVEAGVIEDRDDVFWLTEVEVVGATERLDRGDAVSTAAHLVRERKATARAARRVTPPQQIMQLNLFGARFCRTKGQRVRKDAGNVLRGVAASPGRVTACARVIGGPADFPDMQTGDVLVAPLTTPAWTPLFARAAAIVTDVGGPLSHGSIVAREYGVPAVLGTGDATRRIASGQVVTVDGSAGVVYLSPELTRGGE